MAKGSKLSRAGRLPTVLFGVAVSAVLKAEGYVILFLRICRSASPKESERPPLVRGLNWPSFRTSIPYRGPSSANPLSLWETGLAGRPVQLEVSFAQIRATGSANCRVTLRTLGPLVGSEAQRQVPHPVQEAFRKLHPPGVGELDVVNALEQDA